MSLLNTDTFVKIEDINRKKQILQGFELKASIFSISCIPCQNCAELLLIRNPPGSRYLGNHVNKSSLLKNKEVKLMMSDAGICFPKNKQLITYEYIYFSAMEGNNI